MKNILAKGPDNMTSSEASKSSHIHRHAKPQSKTYFTVSLNTLTAQFYAQFLCNCMSPSNVLERLGLFPI